MPSRTPAMILEVAGEGRRISVSPARLFIGGFTDRDSSAVVWPVGYSRTTCYDLRFPEMFRMILNQGAQLVIVPAARLAHWQLLTRARALENQFFVLARNAAGSPGGVELAGHGVVVAPTGEVVAEAGGSAEQLIADIDLGAVRAFRAEMPVLTDRRLSLKYSVRARPTAQ